MTGLRAAESADGGADRTAATTAGARLSTAVATEATEHHLAEPANGGRPTDQAVDRGGAAGGGRPGPRTPTPVEPPGTAGAPGASGASGIAGAGGVDDAAGTPSAAPGAPAGRDEDAVARFIERFAAELVEAGLQRMASRVFAALLASDTGSLTSAELAEQLRISPAAVSGAIRYLSQVHMVGREREPGSRRDRYQVHTELWYETITRRDQVLSRWEKTLRDGADALGRHTPAGERMAETADFFEYLQGEMLAIMDRWRERQSERREGRAASG